MLRSRLLSPIIWLIFIPFRVVFALIEPFPLSAAQRRNLEDIQHALYHPHCDRDHLDHDD